MPSLSFSTIQQPLTAARFGQKQNKASQTTSAEKIDTQKRENVWLMAKGLTGLFIAPFLNIGLATGQEEANKKFNQVLRGVLTQKNFPAGKSFEKTHFIGTALQDVNLQGTNISNSVFDNFNLFKGGSYQNVDFSKAFFPKQKRKKGLLRFDATKLDGCNFKEATLNNTFAEFGPQKQNTPPTICKDTNFEGSTFSEGAIFFSSEIRGSNFNNTAFGNLRIQDSIVSGSKNSPTTSFRNAKINELFLVNSTMENVDFSGATLKTFVTFAGPDPKINTLENVWMVGTQFMGRNELSRGVKLKNVDFSNASFVPVTASGQAQPGNSFFIDSDTVSFQNCHLEGADLSHVEGLQTRVFDAKNPTTISRTTKFPEGFRVKEAVDDGKLVYID